MENLEDRIPDTLYQFYGFDTGIEKVLKDKTIKFSNPLNFNDPFDCDIRLLDVVKPDLSGLFDRLALEDLSDNSILDESFSSTIYSRLRISCFSKVYDEILMWSHYAEKHKGICVGYNVEKIKSNNYFIQVEYDNSFQSKVIYMDKINDIDNILQFNHLLRFKYKKWEYENEIRWLDMREREFVHFDDLGVKIDEIIFGLRVSEIDIRNKIKELQLYGYNDVKYYQMEKVPNEFKLRKKPIDI